MFHWMLHRLVNRAALGVLAVGAAVGGYSLTRSGDEVTALQRVVVTRACEQVSRDLPARERVTSIAILDIPGDLSGALAACLREAVARSGKYVVIEESFFQRVLAEIRGDSTRPVDRLDEAVSVARRSGVDTVLFGSIQEFATGNDSVRLRAELRLADRGSGEAVFMRSYVETVGARSNSLGYWQARVADSSAGWRMLGWVLFVLLLPIASAPVINWLTERESNAVNLGILLMLTGIDLLAAFALAGFRVGSAWTALLLIGAVGCAGYYNLRAVTMMDALSQ